MSNTHPYEVKYSADYGEEAFIVFGDGREAVLDKTLGHVDLSGIRAAGEPVVAAERLEALAEALGEL